MKLGIVSPWIGPNDGQGRVNREIAMEALRQGHRVVLFSEAVDPALSRHKDVQTVLLPPPRWLPSRLLRDQVFAIRTRRQIEALQNPCNALLVNGFTTWARSDVNAVHFVHSSWLRSPYHPWRLRRDARSFYYCIYNGFNAVLERMAFRRSSCLVAVSRQVERDLISIGVPADRITTITNGVDTTEFHPGQPERERFALPPAVPIALFAGDLRSPRKNLSTVLQALPSVPGLHLAVAGRHDGTPYLRLVRSLGLGDRVHFLGFQTDMPRLMRTVDLFIFPSRYEACSLVLLEALASGIPVVTARSAGGAELISPEVGAVLDDSEDHVRLAEVLRSFLKAGDERRRAMAQDARALAERHSWGIMARRYIDLLQEIPRGHREYNHKDLLKAYGR